MIKICFNINSSKFITMINKTKINLFNIKTSKAISSKIGNRKRINMI
jgi:hypothetical protein